MPEEHMGDIIGDVHGRRGMVIELAERGNMKVVDAKIPLANMFQYVSSLRSMSKGRASYSMEFDSYSTVPAAVQKEITDKYKPKAEVEDLLEENPEDDFVAASSFMLLFGFAVISGIIFAARRSFVPRFMFSTGSSREPLLASSC